MNEVWKKIKGYEEIYEVSNLGNIKSLKRKVKGKVGLRVIQERILKPRNSSEYMIVRLSGVNGKWKDHYIHRLVASAFVKNPDNKPQVNHKDGIKSNNHVDNLEWVTRQENLRHCVELGLKGGKKYGKRLSKEEVIDIRLLVEANEESKTSIAQYFGITYVQLFNIINKKCWKNI
ncbi:NUMOD4 motif-containing HNH endonuclease [Carboxylicivirga sp. RSCT41]|uniref:NUMOD4 motif-containing HNH endonuclease n=1 Tax=Carboxylicivirga agarovorans TaxID=3417570 RepID=UPI003D327C9C